MTDLLVLQKSASPPLSPRKEHLSTRVRVRPKEATTTVLALAAEVQEQSERRIGQDRAPRHPPERNAG